VGRAGSVRQAGALGRRVVGHAFSFSIHARKAWAGPPGWPCGYYMRSRRIGLLVCLFEHGTVLFLKAGIALIYGL
jgi:hypothetical protein